MHDYIVVQSQKVVSAYFTNKQIGLLPFGFAEQHIGLVVCIS